MRECDSTMLVGLMIGAAPATAQSQIYKYGRSYISSELRFHFRNDGDVSHSAAHCFTRVVCLRARAHLQKGGAHFTAGKFPLALTDTADAADGTRNSLAPGIRIAACSHLKEAAADTWAAHFLFAFSDATYAAVVSYTANNPWFLSNCKVDHKNEASTYLWHAKSIQRRHQS